MIGFLFSLLILYSPNTFAQNTQKITGVVIDEQKEPACVQTCITECRVFGDLDDANSEINKAIKDLKAKQYKDELKTGPSVYYVNPF